MAGSLKIGEEVTTCVRRRLAAMVLKMCVRLAVPKASSQCCFFRKTKADSRGLLDLMPALVVTCHTYASPLLPDPPRTRATTTYTEQIHDP